MDKVGGMTKLFFSVAQLLWNPWFEGSVIVVVLN